MGAAAPEDVLQVVCLWPVLFSPPTARETKRNSGIAKIVVSFLEIGVLRPIAL